MQLWECHSSQSSSELWLNATVHLSPTFACHRNSVWFHPGRKNNKDAEVPNDKSPDGWKQSNPLADGTGVTITGGQDSPCLEGVGGRIGLLRVEGTSHTCSHWAEIRMQIEPWPYISGAIKVRICLLLRTEKLTFAIWLQTLRSSPATRKGEKCFKNI